MMHFKKTFLALYVVSCVLMVFGVSGSVDAAFTAPIGAECGEGKETCKTGRCQDVTKGDPKYVGKKYCVCADNNADAKCGEQYGTENGVTWECADESDPFGLNYCKNSNGREEHINPSKAGVMAQPTWEGVTKMLQEDEVKKMISKPALKINIPGLKFSEPTGQNEGDGTYLFVNYIGEYVRAMYRYGVAAASILAVIMIIKAGFMWSVSGGSSDVISKQKETIEKSIVGLVIAVSSYTILFAINPKLVEFNSLKVEYVKTIEMGYASPANEEPTPFGPMTASEGNNSVPYFPQFSGPWALRSPADICNGEGKPCGPPGDKHRDSVCNNPKPCEPSWSYRKKENDQKFCETIWARGCGATSFSMIMAYYGFQTDPFDVGKWSLACKGVFPITATVGDKQKMQEKWPGISSEYIAARNPTGAKRGQIRSKIIESLKNNNPVLYNCSPCNGANRDNSARIEYKGHYVVITGFHDQKDRELASGEEMEKIHLNINDPGGNRGILHAIETMTLKEILDQHLVSGYFKSNNSPSTYQQTASGQPISPNPAEPNASEEEPAEPDMSIDPGVSQ